MDSITIEGLILTPLRIIDGQNGVVMHAMKSGDPGYVGFGEAYFSSVTYQAVKGWKRHRQMNLNLVVPVGIIKIVVYDDRPGSRTAGQCQEIELSTADYKRLSVPPGVWMAFQGKSTGLNLLLNLASIQHDPTESDTLPLDTNKIPYTDWH